jgi:predicted ribosomally synthesized peptide with nif11-like leader
VVVATAAAVPNEQFAKPMNETLTNFRQAVADSTDLQEKVRGGADLVTLGKENGYEFTQEELNDGWKQLQESDEGLTEFELDVVSGGQGGSSGGGS